MSDKAFEKSANRLTKNEIAFVAELSVVSVSRMFGLFMVLPVIALWSKSLTDATPLLIGVAVGGYGVTQALLQVPYGALSDRIGRGPVVIFGLAIFLLGSVIAASSSSIHGLIIGRLLQGAGAISATLSAWLADHTRESVRTMSMAIFGVAIGASFLLALVLGPLLANWVGVRGLFWVSAGCGLLGIVLTAHAMITQPRRVQKTARPTWQWSEVLRPDLLSLDLAIMLLHAALTGFFVIAPFLLLARFSLPDDQHWKVYTLSLAASLIIAIPMIARDGRHRSGAFMLPSIALLVLGFGGMTMAPGLWWFGLGCTVFFAGFSYLEASLPALISLRADINQRGASLGMFSSAQFFGAFLGATASGWIVGRYSPESAMYCLTALVGLWLLLGMGKSLRSAA
ncbi:MAG: MFS transporter [Woeseiaceae bacterium]